MKYYKNNDGEVYAYDETQTPIDGLTEMTQAEIDLHLNPPINKEDYLREIAERKQLGGIDLNGIFISTSAESQALLNGAVSRAFLDNDLLKEYQYHPAGGEPVTLKNSDFLAIGIAIADHVQKVLDAKAVIQQNIDSYNTKEEIQTAFESEYNDEQ